MPVFKDFWKVEIWEITIITHCHVSHCVIKDGQIFTFYLDKINTCELLIPVFNHFVKSLVATESSLKYVHGIIFVTGNYDITIAILL